MNKETTDVLTDVFKKLSKMNYIKPGDVPNINLYMDQVLTFMDEHLSDSKRYEDDKILTKTMINNYTKNDLLPPPVKKKYSKEHIYMLAYIYYFKNILCISDIQKLLTPLTDNFFVSDSTPNMDAIYKEVYNMCKAEMKSLSKDVINKARLADQSFAGLEDSDDKNFLHTFLLVSLLSFDVYIKKNLIENLIDAYTEKQNNAGKEKKNTDKKNTDGDK